jgi:hypothetical protein
MQVHDVHTYLKEEGYIKLVKGNYVLTQKYFNDLLKPAIRLVPFENAVVKQQDAAFPLVIGKDWQQEYIRFIQDAKVPARLEGSRGEVYYANKYSEDGMKAFRNIISKELIDYAMLVRSTILYYKSGTRFKKKIGNYITQGDWRTDYEALKEAATAGEQALREHITKEVDNGEHNSYTLG